MEVRHPVHATRFDAYRIYRTMILCDVNPVPIIAKLLPNVHTQQAQHTCITVQNGVQC
jgi:hypothetical protein